MAMYFGKIYANVWKAEQKNDAGTLIEVQFSTSRKDFRAQNPDRKDNTGRAFSYANSSWGFVKFVGEAAKKGLVDAVENSPDNKPVRITIPEGKAQQTRETYLKDGETLYPKNAQIVVFDFEYSDDYSPSSGGAVMDDEEDEIPFD